MSGPGKLYSAIEDVQGDTVLLDLAIEDLLNSHVDGSSLRPPWPDAKYLILNVDQARAITRARRHLCGSVERLADGFGADAERKP